MKLHKVLPIQRQSRRFSPHMSNIPIPTIHLNGTSKSALIKEYGNAAHAIQEAIDALPQPNGRDYYLQGDMALNRAIELCVNQTRSLLAVLDQINAIREAINNQ